MKSPAVFFDRDNTLIEDPGYISDPAQVRLYDDVPGALERLRAAGYRLVVVTNQSGVARGLLTEDRLTEIHQHLQDLLELEGAGLDAIYACPYLDDPEATVEAYRRHSDLRKPAPGMLLEAAADLELDLARSWVIGDGARDIEAGRRAGCRTILLERDHADPSARQADPDYMVRSLTEAADMVLRTDNTPTGAAANGGAAPDETQSAIGVARPQTSATSAKTQAGTVAGEVRPGAAASHAHAGYTGSGALKRSQVSSPPAGTSSSDDLPRADETLRVLSDIRDLLDRTARRRRQQDFSLLRLAGTLLQLLAVVAALWGLMVMPSDAGAATARFVLAVFLQLATLCAWLAGRQK